MYSLTWVMREPAKRVMLLMMSLFHPGAPLLMISFASTGRLVSDVYCVPLGWCESAVHGISVGDETVFSS